MDQTVYSELKLPLSSISRKQLSKLLVVCKSVANRWIESIAVIALQGPCALET